MNSDSTLRINVWSGPRNVSTALMYSFARRSDTHALDEPLYGHYLRVTRAPHPGADEVMASMCSDGDAVVRDLILGACDRPVLFLKQMAHHLVEVDRTFLAMTANVLLVRDPREMLPSLAGNLAIPTLRDTGLAMQSSLLVELEALGQTVPVLDARQLLLDPRSVLSQLCGMLGIAFQDAMLSWPAGPKQEDGIWAKYWYHAVHQSTGFKPYRPKTDPFPAHLEPLLAECRPHYETLASRTIRAPKSPPAT